MKFQALSWDARDVDDPSGDEDGNEYTISIMGRTEDGRSVCVSTVFAPYFFVKIPKQYRSTSGVSRLFNKVGVGPVGYDLVESKDLWGFQNNEKSLFLKLNFRTHQAMRKCASRLRFHPLPGESTLAKVYESNIDPLIRFMHRTEIQSTGWLEVSTTDDTITNAVPPNSRCDVDLLCSDWKTLKPVVDCDDVAPFVVASFDIESYSSTGKFPDPDIPGDQVFQIAFSLRRANDPPDLEPYEKVCLCYKQTDGPDCVNYRTEKDLLMGFRDYIVSKDLDILTGWNIFGFDLEYLFKRAVVCGCPPKFYQLGKLVDRRSEMVYKQLSSSALGDNKLKLLPMSGRYIFDLFHEIKKEKKLDSYALNSVSKVFLGDQKIDMPPKEMFRRFREEDPVKLGEVAEYCIKDTLLPHRLMSKLCTLLNLLEMAKATWVPVSFLSERGQQIKVFSQITKEAREQGYMVPTITPPGKNNTNNPASSEGYEGATVLEAQKGAYYTPITALDFASLYPSIMMAHNFCYSTLVLDPKYDNVPGVTYETFAVGDRTHKFAQGVPSLLPGILAKLKLYRKKAKKDMAAARGTPMESVYNGKQLAYKISMNSVYGFTGAAATGILPCMAIASSVTCKGRSMIDETKAYVEANFPGSKVRYGDTDSVMVEFDVGETKDTKAAIDASWEMGKRAAAECTKLFKAPNDLELEKVYCPYFLYSKKRYAAKMWTADIETGEVTFDCIDIKGLQVVRRDNTPFVREVCKEVLDIILESNNPTDAKACAHRHGVALLSGKVPIEKLTLSQKLGDSYKGERCPKECRPADGCTHCYNGKVVNLAHVKVRNKIRRREPGSEPQSGDRVPYVLVNADSAFQYDKAEDPKWVTANPTKAVLDYQYYFNNKFMTPVCDLLEPLVDNPKLDIFGDLIAKKPIRIVKNPITNFFHKVT